MRHSNGKLIGVLGLYFVKGGLEVVGHLRGLFGSGSVVDLPERIEHHKIDQLREAHPLDACVVAVLDSKSADFKRMRLQVPIARTDVIVVAGE